jgi:hypothetical protein
MDFKDDAEYAEAKHPRFHNLCSLALVLAHATFAGFEFGVGQAIRLSAWFILPLAFIWKCNDLATWASSSSRGGPSLSDDPAGVRIAGWLILFVFLGLRIYAYV